MILEFSLFQIFSLLSIVASLIVGLIFTFKFLLNRNKNIDKNIFKFRQSFLLVGFLFSLVVIFVVINWTKLESKSNIEYSFENIEEIQLDVIPRTEQKKKLPKPPPPEIIEIPKSEEIEDQPEFLPVDINVDDPIEIPANDALVGDIFQESLPQVKTEGEGDIVNIVEQMPRFPGCENESTQEAKKQCADKKMMDYIYNSLTYPALARENNIKGRVVLRFVVNKKGDVNDVEVIRDIGGGCGQAALNVIKGMNEMSQKWIPGRQGGKKVNVYFTLPIRFELK